MPRSLALLGLAALAAATLGCAPLSSSMRDARRLQRTALVDHACPMRQIHVRCLGADRAELGVCGETQVYVAVVRDGQRTWVAAPGLTHSLVATRRAWVEEAHRSSSSIAH